MPSPDLARAELLLDEQQRLAAWHDSPIGRRYTQAFMLDRLTKHRPIDAAATAESIVRTLRMADSFYVTPEMVDTITHLSHTIPPPDVDDASAARWDLFPPDMHPRGFVRFGKRFLVADRHGRRMAVTGIAWDREPYAAYAGLAGFAEFAGPLGTLSIFTNPTDPDDDYRQEAYTARVAEMPGSVAELLLAHHMALLDPDALVAYQGARREIATIDVEIAALQQEADRLRDDVARLEADHGGELDAERLRAVTARIAELRTTADEATGEHLATGVDETIWEMLPEMAWLVAFWNVIRSRIAGPTLRTGDRSCRKRWERAGMYGPAEVTIIDLRRRDSDRAGSVDGEPEGRVWSHRWIVRPHFRWQSYGPHRSLRRLIVVGGYVKGPDHLPLVVKDEVYRVKR